MTTPALDLNDYEMPFPLIDDATMGYEWETATILRRTSDGSLLYVRESGCSCNGFLDNDLDSDNVTPVTSWQEAVELAKEHFRDEDVFEWAAKLAAE